MKTHNKAMQPAVIQVLNFTRRTAAADLNSYTSRKFLAICLAIIIAATGFEVRADFACSDGSYKSIDWECHQIVTVFSKWERLYDEFITIPFESNKDGTPTKLYSAYDKAVGMFGGYPATPYSYALGDARKYICDKSKQDSRKREILVEFTKVFIKTNVHVQEMDDSFLPFVVACNGRIVKEVIESLSEASRLELRKNVKSPNVLALFSASKEVAP